MPVSFYKRMGLITDLLKESPLKAPQLESIALIEKRTNTKLTGRA